MTKEYIEIKNIKEKQRILLFLFKKFHKICEENGLVYNAFGGTMLGAIRHKGFIPWDDDIDVTMPREDYNKLIDVVKNNGGEELVIHCYPDDNYIYPYAKLGLSQTIQFENLVKKPYDELTINIDIFPVDGCPTNESEIDKYNSCESNIILCTYKVKSRTPKLLLKKWYSKLRGYKFFVNKQIELASKNTIHQSSNVICNGAGWGRKGIVDKNIYYDRILYNFEDTQIWGVKDYDDHMKRLYGDYMKWPPVEKRVSPHDDNAYIKKSLLDEIMAEENGGEK